MHPQDERQLKLSRAFQENDLDSVLGLLGPEMRWPLKQLRSNLRLFFAAAERDHVNLLHPPPDFVTWLQGPLHETVKGPGTARPNTVVARLSTLSQLYNLLMDEALLLQHPLRGLDRPPGERKVEKLPPQEDIERLLIHSESDPELHAALTLMYRHAVQVAELIALRWPAFRHEDGTLLRRRTLTRLDDPSYRALSRLQGAAGGPLSEPQGRIFSFNHNDDLRARIFQLCRAANLTFVNPAKLRKAGLRDFTISADQAGFIGENALSLARALAGRLSEEQAEEERLPARQWRPPEPQ